MEPIEIFRVGTHTTSTGETLTFTPSMLADCARAYDPATSEAPLVIGHPKLDAPAYGWVSGLEFVDGSLRATPDQVEPLFGELVKAGRFKKISSAFYQAHAANNPVPGVLYLRHVGFLGAAAPAVRGLAPVSFAGGSDGVITFGDIESVDRERALQEREAAVRRAEAAHFLEGLAKEGRVLPYEREGIASFMAGLSNDGVVEFSDMDGGAARAGSLDWFRQWLSSRPSVICFAEIAGEERGPRAEHGRYTPPPGYAVDPAGLERHERVVAYQRANGCDYATAVRAVFGG